MISIITVAEKREFFCPQDEEEKKKRCLYLDDAESIEQEFRRIVEWHRGAFWDEMSLKLLKEIDGAVREESYGVETPIGKSCITCLSTGCKLGLVLWYYKNKDLRILTSFYRAGGNVWRFIAENFDISIFVLKSELESVLYSERDYSIVVDGRLCTEEDRRKLWELGIDAENEIYKVTPEKEKEAYEAWLKGREEYLVRPLKEELALGVFWKMMPNYGDIKKEDLPEGYQVINTCSCLKNNMRFRKLPLWIVGRRGEQYEFSAECSVKYPVFMELLVYDILDGRYWLNDRGDTQPYNERYEEYIVLVLEGEERCPVKEYTEHVYFGALCEPEKKRLTVLEPGQAVQLFHDWYGKMC